MLRRTVDPEPTASQMRRSHTVAFRPPARYGKLMGRSLAIAAALVWLASGPPAPLWTSARAAEPDPLAAARKQFLTGHYGEALEAYEAILANKAETPAADAALGAIRCRLATGEIDEAAKALAAAEIAFAKDARFPAERAALAFGQGDYQQAGAAAAAALKLDADQPLARYVSAQLDEQTGRLEAAEQDYKWFVDYYNAHNVADPDTLRLVGLATAQWARWRRAQDQFSFLVNDLWADALAAAPEYWPAHYESGRLFMEKYNQAEAERELKAALAVNPSAAEAYAAVAELAIESYDLDQAQTAIDRALEINPRLAAAHRAQADIHFCNCEPQKAIAPLTKALGLNPRDPATLGRLVTAHAAVDGLPLDKLAGSPAGKIVAEVEAANPHAGAFWATIGDSFDRLRRYPAAGEAYARAIDAMPQLLGARGAWGMVLMRLGDEERAKKVLDEAFAADPFNARVRNTLQVLDVLSGYQTLETAHFRIRFDPKKDKLLAHCAAAWLEEVYPQLCQQMGYTPPEKSLFEIFNQAKNTDGHGWFSARMVGLPHVHTIGACAGKMVAMQSPIGGQPFNWGRVLKHEFIHVLNLQQTHFNIPHWYTEALATLNEGYPRPQIWNELLVERHKNHQLFNLETINLGFIRAHSSEEWNLAYCQAELYAEYMLARFGDDALARMLAAYADNLTTPEAIPRAFQVDQADFERGYQEHVGKLVAELAGRGSASEKSLAEVTKALAADPKNPGLLAEMALANLRRKQYPEARRLADAARKLEPREQLAAYVRARLHLLVGENAEALKTLEDALDENHPQPQLLSLLAGLRLRSESFDEAGRLYELGAKADPDNLQWTKSLATVYLKNNDRPRLAATLSKLAEFDAEEFHVRKKLAELALAAEDWAGVERWTVSGIHINVLDPDLRLWRAQAAVRRHEPAVAIDECHAAVEIDPEQPASRFTLAEALRDAGQKNEARAALAECLRLDPKYPGAEALSKSLE